MGQGIANATQVAWANQTPAAQATARLAAGVRASGAPRRRRRKAKSSVRRRVRRARVRVSKVKRRVRSTKKRLVKGSAAAKRYMARLRAMRKR